MDYHALVDRADALKEQYDRTRSRREKDSLRNQFNETTNLINQQAGHRVMITLR